MDKTHPQRSGTVALKPRQQAGTHLTERAGI